MTGLLVLLLAVGGGAWWWAGTPQSLGAVLGYVLRYLPADQKLEVRDVEASLLGGGRIGWLRWSSPTLAVEVTDLDIGWRLRPLLARRLELGKLSAAKVVATPIAAAQPQPAAPLQSLVLPIEIDAPFAVQQIDWNGPPTTTVKALAGHYRYAGDRHQLQIDGIDVADGRYQGQLSLQGATPLAIDASLRGRIQVPMAPGTMPLVVQAEATLHGTLAAPDARLAVSARVAPEGGTGADQAMRATVDAEIAPWAAQPIVAGKADLARIDAARFWPGAPTTDLSGRIDAGPSPTPGTNGSTAWQARADIRNAAPGPWNAHKLPVTRVDAQLRYDGQRWTFAPSTVELADGQVQLEGHWSPAPLPWQVEASVRQVKPALLYTGLDTAPVSGRVQAQAQDGAIRFDLALKAEPGRSTAAAGGALLGGFRIDQAQAVGQWRDQTLDLQKLRVDAGPARVEGTARAQFTQKSGSAKIDLVAPGATVRVEGQAAPAQGNGQGRIEISDADALQRWVAGLPGMANVFAGAAASGAARVDARWQGGWAGWQQQLASPSTAVKGLTVQLALATPRFDLQLPASAATPAPSRLQLRDLRAELAGSPAEATLSLDGTAALNAQELTLRARASGGIAGQDQWRLALASLRAQAKLPGSPQTTPWTVELDAPLQMSLRRAALSSAPPASPASPANAANAMAGWRLEASAASASVRGPAAGAVRLEWQPLLFVQSPPAAGSSTPRYQLRSQGRLLGLPMAWAQLLGGDFDLQQRTGISGDLVLDGAWDIDAGDSLRANARILRRSGDIRVRAGDDAQIRRIRTEGTGTLSETRFDDGQRADAPATPAGIRRAELTLSAVGDDVRAQLQWDTERAGQATADIRTRVVQRDGAWSWPEDAPLSGAVQASMPDVGVWSVLAPPAWRIDGTLAANATLAGTRAAPQWNGSLSADRLAIKAAVEGVELRDGRLRATLRGNTLVIDDFTLQGGSASRARIAGPGGNLSTVSSEAAKDGGELKASGEVRWGAPSTGASAGASELQMALSVRLRALRVLVRSDRQVTVSGQLQAALEQGQINLRGVLTADRGVIILPDETAPTLGSDVVIRSAAIAREAAAKQAKAAASADAAFQREAAATPRKPPDIAVTIDMGTDFAVQGHGLTTRLGGQIEVRSSAATGGQPRITGEIRTVNGRYRAYGQQLDVDSGVARFNGPYDNPSLDILALRPNIEQKAGVRITGPAQSPRVALYSQPTLTDAETLSWMMLGRATSGGGAEAAVMQQAALALLGGFGPKGGGGNFASRFGLDEIGFKGPETGEALRNSAITLGKRLSNEVYVTYEASLAGALGTLYIFYDLTRHLALRGQAGTRGAIDLIYTITFD